MFEPALLAHQVNPAATPTSEDWKPIWKRYETLRFARLCHYLRARQADAVIWHSIFIFRLTNSEIKGAVGGTAKEYQDLIEAAIKRR